MNFFLSYSSNYTIKYLSRCTMNVKDESKYNTILIVLPYGIGWKSIINDDILKSISNFGFRIVILAEDNMINSSDPNIIVRPLIKYQRSRFEIAFGLLRNYVFADDDKNHSETLKLKISQFNNRHPVLSLFRKFIGKSLSKSNIINSLFAWIDSTLFLDNNYKEIFDTYNPQVIFVTYPFSFYTYPVVRRGKKMNIPMIAYVPSWDNLTSKWEVPVKFDQLIVWNKIMQNEAIEFLNYKSSQVKICGVPQFDLHHDSSLIRDRKKFIQSFGGNPDKNIIVYATGTKQLSDIEPNIVEIIQTAIEENKLHKPCQLLLRVHPRRSTSDFQNVIEKPDVFLQIPGKSSNEFIESGYHWKSDIEDYGILSNTLFHSDVMINVASTITIESCIFDTPVINIAFDTDQDINSFKSVKRHFQYSHYMHLLNSNGVKIARSSDELLNNINDYLDDPGLDSDGRARIVESQCYKIDGQSSERLLKYIVDFVNEKIDYNR